MLVAYRWLCIRSPDVYYITLAQLTTQWVSPSDWSVRIRSMYMWTSEGNGQALSLPMHEMGGTPNANVSTD